MEIKKNMPIPETSKGKKPIYPFASMDIGDALSLAKTVDFEKARRAAASFQRRNKGFVFTSRSKYVNGRKSKAGGSIWRVE
jgi:hypothetical protein